MTGLTFQTIAPTCCSPVSLQDTVQRITALNISACTYFKTTDHEVGYTLCVLLYYSSQFSSTMLSLATATHRYFIATLCLAPREFRVVAEILRSTLTAHHKPHYDISDSNLIGNSAHLSYEWQVWKTGRSGQLVDELSMHWLNQHTSYLSQKYQTHIILRFSSTCSSHMGHNKSTEMKILLCTHKITILRFCLVKAGTHAL